VITQIKLPPYRGPHSALDMVPSEIVFGHIFELFHQMSQADTDDQTVAAGDDHQPSKRTHKVSTAKKIPVAK
jgi:hypothetical protein